MAEKIATIEQQHAAIRQALEILRAQGIPAQWIIIDWGKPVTGLSLPGISPPEGWDYLTFADAQANDIMSSRSPGG